MCRNLIILVFWLTPILGFSQAGNVLSSYSLNATTDSLFFDKTEISGNFGVSMCNIGDLNGDGIVDLAIGCFRKTKPAVAIVFLNSDGSVKDSQMIYPNYGGFTGSLPSNMEGFGKAVASIGDLDGDGIQDIIVGKPYGGSSEIFVLFMKRDGTVKKFTRIGEFRGGLNIELSSDTKLGTSISVLRDFDGDGIPEIAVGDINDNTGGLRRGAVYILFLNSDGTVKRIKKIAQNTSGFSATLSDSEKFGSSTCFLGDSQLVVGSLGPDVSGLLYVLNLNDSLQVTNYSRIGSGLGGLQDTVTKLAFFGASLDNVGDIDGDLVDDMLVGADSYTDIYDYSGAAFLLFMNKNGTVKSEKKYSNSFGPIPDSLSRIASYGRSVCGLGDLNGDGKYDIAIAAPTFLTPGTIAKRRGRIDFIFLDGTSHASTTQIKTETITIYPNPTTGLVNLDAYLKIQEVSVTNQYGQELFKLQGINITKFKLPNFTKGLYFIEAVSSSGRYTSKLIIKKT
jgi:hypothetical protein